MLALIEAESVHPFARKGPSVAPRKKRGRRKPRSARVAPPTIHNEEPKMTMSDVETTACNALSARSIFSKRRSQAKKKCVQLCQAIHILPNIVRNTPLAASTSRPFPASSQKGGDFFQRTERPCSSYGDSNEASGSGGHSAFTTRRVPIRNECSSTEFKRFKSSTDILN